MKATNIYDSDTLHDYLERDISFIEDKWSVTRPLGHSSMWYRIKAAWLVFQGKGDVITWYKQ